MAIEHIMLHVFGAMWGLITSMQYPIVGAIGFFGNLLKLILGL